MMKNKDETYMRKKDSHCYSSVIVIVRFLLIFDHCWEFEICWTSARETSGRVGIERLIPLEYPSLV
jgi:hypothetical protein